MECINSGITNKGAWTDSKYLILSVKGYAYVVKVPFVRKIMAWINYMIRGNSGSCLLDKSFYLKPFHYQSTHFLGTFQTTFWCPVQKHLIHSACNKGNFIGWFGRKTKEMKVVKNSFQKTAEAFQHKPCQIGLYQPIKKNSVLYAKIIKDISSPTPSSTRVFAGEGFGERGAFWKKLPSPQGLL